MINCWKSGFLERSDYCLPCLPSYATISMSTVSLPELLYVRRRYYTRGIQLDGEYSQDMDWIRFTAYSFVRECESESFKRSHSEEWCKKAHVWHFIDTVFSNVSEIEILR